MERARKSDANRRSNPTLQDEGLSIAQSPSFTPHHPDPSRATLYKWILDPLEKSSDVDGGIVKHLVDLVRSYLEQYELAAVKHEDAVLVLKEHRQRMCLLTDDSKLDQRVAEAPEVIASIVSDLTDVVDVLSKGHLPASAEKILSLIRHSGIDLVTPEKRQGLRKETEQVIEQASAIALVHQQRSTLHSPNNIIEFLEATKCDLRARIEQLFGLLPTTHNLINDLGEIEPRQVQGIPLDQQKSADQYQILKGALEQAFPSAYKPFGGASYASYSIGSRPRAHLKLSDKTMNGSFSSTKSPWSPSVFSKVFNRYRSHPLAETATSPPVSESSQSSSELHKSSSIRTPSSRKSCETPDNKIHHCLTIGNLCLLCWAVQSIINCYLLFSSGIRRPERFEHEQLVRVWHHNGQKHQAYVALLDTGCGENFISKVLVEELKLVQTKCDLLPFTGVDGRDFTVDHFVRPRWEFYDRRGSHRDFHFFVVSKLPRDIHVVLGRIAQKQLGVDLYIHDGACVAQEDSLDLPTKEKEQRQRQLQALDVTASQTKRRQDLDAQHTSLIQRRNAANVSKETSSVNPTSQKVGAGSCDVQKR